MTFRDQMKLGRALAAVWMAILVSSCGLNPRHVNLDLNKTLPEVKTTFFSQAIVELGKSNLIYGRDTINVMAKPMVDNTGTSVATNFEIPRDISEMVKSTLNGIGGNVVYIPYDPEFMINTAQTGYSDWGDKTLPDVILVGGITEFDRGLITNEKNFNLGVDGEEQFNVPISLEVADGRKSSLANITLDFNFIDFKTFSGIPFIQAITNIKVNKGVGEDELGFTVYGQNLGLRGNIKKIQGRHAAIRLLVQLSTIQVIGKYQNLPYWRLIPNTDPDPRVMDQLRDAFYRLNTTDQIVKIQEYLYLYGEEVAITGVLDKATRTAIAAFQANTSLETANPIGETVYLAIFDAIPLDYKAVQRRREVDKLLETYRQIAQIEAVVPERVVPVTIPEAQLGTVTIRTNQETYQIGENLEVYLDVTEPMFVRLLSINAQGQITTIFPNPYQSDNYVLPGQSYAIPSVKAPFTLKIGAPAGIDKILAIAAVNSIPASLLPLTSEGEFDVSQSENFAYARMEVTVLP